MKCFRAAEGKVAVWEKPASGDPMAPFYDPSNHMDLVYFHSDLRYLSNTLEQDVTINHTQLNGLTGSAVAGAPGQGTSAQLIANGDIRSSSIDLLSHGLGYTPPAFVLLDGQILAGSTAIQSTTAGARFCSSWADATKVGLREIAFSSTANLVAVSKTYKVLCFRQFEGDPALPTFRAKPGEGIIVFGEGRITQDDRPIRVPADPSDAEWYVPVTIAVDCKNGAIRTLSAISGATDRGLYTGSLFDLRAVLMSNS